MAAVDEEERRLHTHFFYVHRLRPTYPVNFRTELSPCIIKGGQAVDQALDALQASREAWSKLFFETRDLDQLNRDTVVQATSEYVQLLLAALGQQANPNGSLESAAAGPSLRRGVTFAWRTVAGQEREHRYQDLHFELMSVLFNQAVWYLGYSEFLISHLGRLKADIEARRKTAYDSLLKAAGIFQILVGKNNALNGPIPVDFNDNFLKALDQQALAQAQEITIHRAIGQQNKPDLIAKLAYSTADMYHAAATFLQSFDDPAAERLLKFLAYLKYKSLLYRGIGLYYQGFALRQQNDYGNAIALLRASVTVCTESSTECERFMRSHPQSPNADPNLPIANFRKVLDFDLGKFTRLNDGVAYAKIPDVAPDALPSQTLAKATAFDWPAQSSIITPTLLASFDTQKKGQTDAVADATAPGTAQPEDKPDKCSVQ